MRTTDMRSVSLRFRSKLLFGRMFEDWTLESSLFSPGGKVFCIASAGCTTLELAARGHLVDSVDINPAQARYIKERLSGAPYRDGVVDHHLRKARRFLSWIGLGGKKLETFLLMRDPAEQIHFWKTRLISNVHSRLLDIALSRLVLRFFQYEKSHRSLRAQFSRNIRQRLERSFSIHPNRTNIFAWRLLMDREAPEQPAKVPITIVPSVRCDEAVHFLETCSPDYYDGFSLSNILAGAGEDYSKRLWNAVHRAARPGAVIVLRSFHEPRNDSESFWASQDRAMLWGRIIVCKRESL
jgi:S-adenosylmethionine:diacylglycerol 3-amino-3-carboxypropyl transferase